MLEEYFVMPATVDRIRGSWLGPEIERYVAWMAEQDDQACTVSRRVPVLMAFGEFARGRGATAVQGQPAHIEAFVAERVAARARFRRDGLVRSTLAKEIRVPIEQMLTVVLPGFVGSGRRRRELPFAVAVPGFFEYLVAECQWPGRAGKRQPFHVQF